MSYPLPKEARALQAAVRRYVDEELIPWEVHAEMNHGEVPPEILARQKKAARDLGLSSMDAPKTLGGGGMSMLLQAVAQEQTGRVTNALGWRFSNVQRWMTEACSPHQIETWVKPLIADTRHECYAITEAEAGSDVDAIQATARRDGAKQVVRTYLAGIFPNEFGRQSTGGAAKAATA